MALTVQDRKIISEQFEGMTELMHANFENVQDKFKYMDDKLEAIKIQTTKTNGRVTDLEKRANSNDILHARNESENKGTMTQRDRDDNERNLMRQKTVQTITLIIMALGLCFTAYGVINNSRRIENLVTVEGANNKIDANSKINLRGGIVIDSIAPEYWTNKEENDSNPK